MSRPAWRISGLPKGRPAEAVALSAAPAPSHRSSDVCRNNPLSTCAHFWESDAHSKKSVVFVKRLILMRHAKSDWSATGDDHSRPLNGRGKDSAQAMGRWLAAQGWVPDEVLCSTSARTRQTLALLGLPQVPTRYERALYLAEADEIIDTLRSATEDTVLLLGHNHGIAECANALVSKAPNHPRFRDYPTCATSLIRFDVAHWSDLREGTGACEEFTVPREVIAERHSG